MSVYNAHGIRIDYNPNLRRFSILKGRDWVSISPTVLNLLFTLNEINSPYERVTVHQHGSQIEIVKLATNFLIIFVARNISGSLMMESNVIQELNVQKTSIMNRVKSENPNPKFENSKSKSENTKVKSENPKAKSENHKKPEKTEKNMQPVKKKYFEMPDKAGKSIIIQSSVSEDCLLLSHIN